jgi:hypothetical protein
LKLLAKLGTLSLAVSLVAVSVAACTIPGAEMTNVERDCCQHMAEQCHQGSMAKSHPCCQATPSSVDFHALKISPLQANHFSLVVFHTLPPTAQADAYFLSKRSSRVLCTHGPPGLASTITTTILRI